MVGLSEVDQFDEQVPCHYDVAGSQVQMDDLMMLEEADGVGEMGEEI